MTLTATNLHFPLPQQLTIDRASLLEKLALVPQHRLTLIVAPPGYGKTTLVTQYARETPLAVAWQTVEKTDRDASSLFERSRACLAEIVPSILTIDRPPGASPAEMAALIADHLRENLRHDIIYVLDDIHYLIDSQSGGAWLRALVASLPSACHLILMGRALPTISVAEMIARRDVLAIGQDQLRFSFEEVAELAKQAAVTLSASQIQQIHARLDGWPAGVLLALQPLPSDLDAILFSEQGGPEGLFAALAEAMLRAQPPLLQEFLLCSSTLSRMTPTLCQNALHLEDSLEYLNDALSRNLFIAQIPGGLAYHPLFRDFLQRQLQARDPALFAHLHAEAARWFEADNRLDEAFDHYIAAGLYAEAAAIAERAVQAYFARGQAETLLTWKSQLDGTGIRAPRLAFTCGMIHRDRYDYDSARVCLDEAEEGFRAQSSDTGLIQVALLKATISNQRGDYQGAIEQAEPYVSVPSVPPNLRGYAMEIIGTAHLYLGNVNQAIQDLEAALPLWRAHGDMFAVAHLLMTIELAYLRQGRFDDATACLQEVVAIRRALGGSVGIAMALNNLGYHHHLLGEYDLAQATLREALETTSRVPESMAEGYASWSMGDLLRDRGAVDEAAAHYNRALQLTVTSEPSLRSNVLVSLATLRRWQGRLDDAHALATEAASVAESYNLSLEKLEAETACWGVRIERGEVTEARSALAELAAAFESYHYPVGLVRALGLCAYASLLSGETAEASQLLTWAVRAVPHPANLQPLVAEIFHLPRLRAFVAGQAGRFDILNDGLARLESARLEAPRPKPSRRPIILPTISLRVWTLGEESIERDGKSVPLSAWQAASARELFFFLLFKGASTREQIGLAFWPDCSMQQVRQKFHTTLHRVRDAVGTNAIVFEDGRYAINPNIDIWCDTFEFESLVRQAQLASPRMAHTEGLWRRAVDLYRGDFLSSFDADWVVHYRESLTQTYLDALLALGNCVRVRGNLQEAIAIFQSALAVDSYREDVHRALLTCYAALGERSLIARHSDRLTELLESELGIAPSLETRALVQTLLS